MLATFTSGCDVAPCLQAPLSALYLSFRSSRLTFSVGAFEVRRTFLRELISLHSLASNVRILQYWT